MKAAVMGIATLAILGLVLFAVLGFFTVVVAIASETEEQGPLVPPPLEAAYRQVAAERASDWATLAAWDAPRTCAALPPKSQCPPPKDLTAADRVQFLRHAHRIWYHGVLGHIRNHADQMTDPKEEPEAHFQELIAEDDYLIDAPVAELSPGWTPIDGFARPASGPLTSRYGLRISPIDGRERLHAGIDLGIPTGIPIQASKDGVVIRAESDPVFGLVVDGGGYQSLYAHNSWLEVVPGITVQQAGAGALPLRLHRPLHRPAPALRDPLPGQPG